MARKSLFGDDEGRIGGSRAPEEADLDITPMIDVTFLLLIFFMVTSTMQGEKDLDVPPAVHGIGVPTQGSAIITIKAGLADADPPTILLGDGRGPEATVDEVPAYVRELMTGTEIEVIIKADRAVPTGFVQKVLKVVSEIDGTKFSIGVQDKTG